MFELFWVPRPEVLANQFASAAIALETMEAPLEESARIIGEGMQTTIHEHPGWAEHAYETTQKLGPHDLLILNWDLYDSLTDEGNYQVRSTGVEGYVAWTGDAAPPYWTYQVGEHERPPERDFTQWEHAEQLGEIDALWTAWVDAAIGGFGGGRTVNVGRSGTRAFGVHPVTGNVGFIPR